MSTPDQYTRISARAASFSRVPFRAPSGTAIPRSSHEHTNNLDASRCGITNFFCVSNLRTVQARKQLILSHIDHPNSSLPPYSCSVGQIFQPPLTHASVQQKPDFASSRIWSFTLIRCIGDVDVVMLIISIKDSVSKSLTLILITQSLINFETTLP